MQNNAAKSKLRQLTLNNKRPLNTIIFRNNKIIF